MPSLCLSPFHVHHLTATIIATPTPDITGQCPSRTKRPAVCRPDQKKLTEPKILITKKQKRRGITFPAAACWGESETRSPETDILRRQGPPHPRRNSDKRARLNRLCGSLSQNMCSRWPTDLEFMSRPREPVFPKRLPRVVMSRTRPALWRTSVCGVRTITSRKPVFPQCQACTSPRHPTSSVPFASMNFLKSVRSFLMAWSSILRAAPAFSSSPVASQSS